MLNNSENSNFDEVIDDTVVRITKVVPGNRNGSLCIHWRQKNMHFKVRVYFGVIKKGMIFIWAINEFSKIWQAFFQKTPFSKATLEIDPKKIHSFSQFFAFVTLPTRRKLAVLASRQNVRLIEVLRNFMTVKIGSFWAWRVKVIYRFQMTRTVEIFLFKFNANLKNYFKFTHNYAIFCFNSKHEFEHFSSIQWTQKLNQQKS